MFTFPTTMFSGGSLIKSIQQVSITITSTNTSATATISSVDTSKTAIFWGGLSVTDAASSSTGVNSANDFVGVTLTNATTVTATRFGNSATINPTVKVTVVEFNAFAVKSVQYGTISLGNGETSDTATVTGVTTANSVCLFLGAVQESGTSVQVERSAFCSVNLTDSTTVTAFRNTQTSIGYTVYFCLLEFTSAVLKSSTQQFTTAIVTNTTSGTSTISAVDTSLAALFWGGFTITFTASYNPINQVYLQLTNGTTVTATRQNNISNGLVSVMGTVVEFKSAFVKSIQRGLSVITTGNSSQGDTITSVNTAKSFVTYLGSNINTNLSGGDSGRAFPAVTLTNATTMTSSIGVATGLAQETTTSYNVIELQ